MTSTKELFCHVDHRFHSRTATISYCCQLLSSMGIPKFFRYISERYPLVSQFIDGNKIPEFDNLYLDFNSIIHQCSHPSDDAHSRITEDQIFSSIFLYVDHLFEKIRPKSVFYLAVDGVSPRAKMNQQRSRRFRAAKEAQDLNNGIEAGIPPQAGFDSNGVTPGTPFMARLSESLKYYVHKKITDDANWRDVKVILSGPDVPGEGEHKIMEYIRLSRTHPNYNSNTRHCLYGLDSDLIMLGLLSHEPHFCLLREEVSFGPDSKRRNHRGLDSMNFYLLHLSLMREYLDIEFRDLDLQLSFEYNLENVIDDFILLAAFSGNDFLPDLPGFHITQSGLENLFDIYKTVLPTLDGYINSDGSISLKRLQVLLDEMSKLDQKAFEKEYAYLKGLDRKMVKQVDEIEKDMEESKFTMAISERTIFDQVKEYVLSNRNESRSCTSSTLTMPNVFSTRERAFIIRLSQDLNLEVQWDQLDKDGNSVVVWALREGSEDEDIRSSGSGSNSEAEKSDIAKSDDIATRALVMYNDAPIVDHKGYSGFEAGYENVAKEKLVEWKKRYYGEKLGTSYSHPEKIKEIVYRYIEGLQWVIRYYYQGVPSWSWFYDYHYAPRVSDLRNIEDMNFKFDVGKPFRPFEHLMAVLPPASMGHVPSAYRDLMTGPNSPIVDFYPITFEVDLNGKKRDWEAVMKIPFVDERRLLHAMKTREHRLTREETTRNILSTPLMLTYTLENLEFSPSPLSKLPHIYRCHCKVEPFCLPEYVEVPCLCDGVLLGKYSPAGFPSLKTLPHSAVLGHHSINVYGPESTQHKSINNSVMVTVTSPFKSLSTEEIATTTIGKRIFTGWPFLWEGLVIAVSDSSSRYENSSQKIGFTRHTIAESATWKSHVNHAEWIQRNRHGVSIGQVEVLLHVRPLIGMTVSEVGESVKEYALESNMIDCPAQLCVKSVESEDGRFLETGPLSLKDSFPEGTKVFFLADSAYGGLVDVVSTTDTKLSIRVECMPSVTAEVQRIKAIINAQTSSKYMPSYKVATLLGISTLALSKITSSFPVAIDSNKPKINIGLEMKFDRKGFKVVGYTKKEGRLWEYSDKAVDLVKTYKEHFPEVFECLAKVGDSIPLATDIFRSSDPETRMMEAKKWLEANGVHNFQKAPLSYDELSEDVIMRIDEEIDGLSSAALSGRTTERTIDNYPCPVILKSEHCNYRLKNQVFALGDRVRMVKNSGPIPLASKGIIIGHDELFVDVVWDEPFMLGTTLGGRCPEGRGMTADPTSCLNLTNPQFIVSMNNIPGSPVSLTYSRGHLLQQEANSGPPPGLSNMTFRNVAWNSPVVPRLPYSNFFSAQPVPVFRRSVDARGGGALGLANNPNQPENRLAFSRENNSTKEWQTVTRRGRSSHTPRSYPTASPTRASGSRGRGSVSMLGGPGFVLPSGHAPPRGRGGPRGRGRA